MQNVKQLNRLAAAFSRYDEPVQVVNIARRKRVNRIPYEQEEDEVK
jgi:hypothetical protein